MIKYGSDKPTSRQAVVYDTFLSADYAKASAHVSKYHSPNTLNMIRDEYGKVRRRMGYFPYLTFTDDVWGVTKYDGNFIVHTGTKLYKVTFTGTTQVNTELYATMAEALSRFYVYKNILYIMDGTNYLSYNGTTCASITGKAPMVAIGGAPGTTSANGSSGTLYEQFNMLSNAGQQSYAGDGTGTYFPLAFKGLDSELVSVSIYNGATWDIYVENADYVATVTNVDWVSWNQTITAATYNSIEPALQAYYEHRFTVDRTNGIISFSTHRIPPAATGGADNVKITAYKDRSTERAKILNCTLMLPFGIGGDENMLFMSGNPTYPNQVYWSAVDDPTYFADLQYAYLGQDTSAITGLGSIDTGLLCHKDGVSGTHYLLTLGLEEINGLYVPQATVSKVISGSGCIAPYCCQNFGEPLFISPLGVQAITYREITTREVETIRGDRINKKLLAETGLSGALSCVYKYFYLISVNGHVYVLDRLNPTSENGVLTNAAQYNAFYWDNIAATCWYTDQTNLYFGTADGKVMQFYTDETSTASYQDNGADYNWSWEFPEYTGNVFYENKAIRYIALRAKSYPHSTVTIDVQLNGEWYEVLTDSISFGHLDLDDLDLDNLNLSTDTTPKMTSIRYSERKLEKLAFRVRGSTKAEPFGLYSFAFEVKERGKHKG